MLYPLSYEGTTSILEMLGARDDRRDLVEVRGLEPLASAMRTQRSTS